MITSEKIAILKGFESNLNKFHDEFRKVFVTTLTENVSLLESDHVIITFMLGDFDGLRKYLDFITDESKKHVLEALQEGENNLFQEQRYKDVKEVNDLFTYYYEIMVK